MFANFKNIVTIYLCHKLNDLHYFLLSKRKLKVCIFLKPHSQLLKASVTPSQFFSLDFDEMIYLEVIFKNHIFILKSVHHKPAYK